VIPGLGIAERALNDPRNLTSTNSDTSKHHENHNIKIEKRTTIKEAIKTLQTWWSPGLPVLVNTLAADARRTLHDQRRMGVSAREDIEKQQFNGGIQTSMRRAPDSPLALASDCSVLQIAQPPGDVAVRA
jgi:hypothetical protein